MKTKEKRKILLKQLDEKYNQIYNSVLKFNKLSGSGLKRKFQRLIFVPDIYIPYILFKLEIIKSKKAKLFWGKEISVNTNDSDGAFLALFGLLVFGAEYKLTKFFIKNLKEDDVFYDVGANYGFYTALASEFCKEVYSFEPLPYVFECLEMSFKDTSNVFLNNVALSNKEGEIEMFTTLSSCVSTIIKERANKIQEYIGHKIKIETTTLDNFTSSKSKPTVIKLDVEGAESLIIDGGIEFLKNNNPTIAIEVWSQEEGYEISKKAIEKLKNLGYQPYFINNKGELEKVEYELSNKIKENTFENFIFKKL